MNNDTRSHVLNCVLWALVGFAVGTVLGEYTSLYRWVTISIGSIVAGIAGWISVDPTEVRQRFAENWRRLRDWEPNKEWHKAFWSSVPLAFLALSATFASVMVSFFLVVTDGPHIEFQDKLVAGGISGVLMASAVIALSAWMLFDSSRVEYDLDRAHQLMVSVAALLNPVMLPLLCIRGMAYGAFEMAFGIGGCLKRLGKVAWATVIQVHSKRRMLRAIDCSVAAMIGLYYGQVLLLVVVAFFFSSAHYELISKRLLGLEPNGA